MKIRRLIALIVVIVVVAIGLVLFTDLFGDRLLPQFPRLRFFSTSQYATSSITLENVRKLYSFTTVEYVQRSIFPYDYFGEGLSINDILRKLRPGSATPESALTPEERLFLEAFNLATELGLNRGSSFDFVVVTVVHTAGYDLSRELDAGQIVIEEQERDGQTVSRITMTLPDPEIIDTRIEDIDSENYPYPDVPVSAGEFGRIARFVESQPLPENTRDEIIFSARESGRRFLTGLLLQAGFSEVIVQ